MICDHIQVAFEKFHAENPHVYAELVRLSRRAKENGKDCFGIGCIWEVLRWNLLFEIKTVRGEGESKLNNNHRSRYARLIMQQEPDLKGFFNLRELGVDRAEPESELGR